MKAFRQLVKYTAAAEDKVLSLRKEVCRNTTTASVSIPGFNASALTTSKADGYSPAMRSVAEETITCHKRIEPFDWQPPDCYGCGGPHKYMKYGKINCPNAERPGYKESEEQA